MGEYDPTKDPWLASDARGADASAPSKSSAQSTKYDPANDPFITPRQSKSEAPKPEASAPAKQGVGSYSTLQKLANGFQIMPNHGTFAPKAQQTVDPMRIEPSDYTENVSRGRSRGLTTLTGKDIQQITAPLDAGLQSVVRPAIGANPIMNAGPLMAHTLQTANAFTGGLGSTLFPQTFDEINKAGDTGSPLANEVLGAAENVAPYMTPAAPLALAGSGASTAINVAEGNESLAAGAGDFALMAAGLKGFKAAGAVEKIVPRIAANVGISEAMYAGAQAVHGAPVTAGGVIGAGLTAVPFGIKGHSAQNIAPQNDWVGTVHAMVDDAAGKYNVDPDLLKGLLHSENGPLDPAAKSSTGVTGLAQFTKATAKAYGVDRADPASNVDGLAHYMSDLLKKHNGDEAAAIAEYKGVGAKKGGARPKDVQKALRIVQQFRAGEHTDAQSGFQPPETRTASEDTAADDAVVPEPVVAPVEPSATELPLDDQNGIQIDEPVLGGQVEESVSGGDQQGSDRAQFESVDGGIPADGQDRQNNAEESFARARDFGSDRGGESLGQRAPGENETPSREDHVVSDALEVSTDASALGGTSDRTPNDGQHPSSVEGVHYGERPILREVAHGNKTSVQSPTGNEYGGHYAVVDLSEITPSNDPRSFSAHADYPPQVQDRDYAHSHDEQAKVIRNGNDLSPAHLINDSPVSDVGPPIVDSKGRVAGGNGRSMSMVRSFASDPKAQQEYKATLVKKASQFGIDPEAIRAEKNPVLVRVLPDVELKSDQQSAALVRELNLSQTTEKDATASAISAGNSLTPEQHEAIGQVLEKHETLGDAFGDAATSKQLIRSLEKGNIITNENRPRLVEQTKRGPMLSDAGKDFVTDLMASRVLKDPDVARQTPPAIRQKIAKAALPLAQAGRFEGWSLEHPIREAIEDINAQRASGLNDQEWRSQISFDREPLSRAGEAMRNLLADTRQKPLREFAERYASEARADKGESTDEMFGKPERDPAETLVKLAERATGKAIEGRPQYTRDDFSRDLQTNTKLTPDERTANLALADAFAKQRARMTGGKAEDFYTEFLRGVTRDAPTTQDALAQSLSGLSESDYRRIKDLDRAPKRNQEGKYANSIEARKAMAETRRAKGFERARDVYAREMAARLGATDPTKLFAERPDVELDFLRERQAKVVDALQKKYPDVERGIGFFRRLLDTHPESFSDPLVAELSRNHTAMLKLPEVPVRAALKFENGDMSLGRTHNEALDAAEAKGLRGGQVEEEGYYTNHGRFVGREDAAKLVGMTGRLHSEQTIQSIRKGEPVLYQLLDLDVYHGTKQPFDKFSDEKIGTGEGTQFEGHGHYVTENRKTAEWYAKEITDVHSNRDGRYPDEFELGSGHNVTWAADQFGHKGALTEVGAKRIIDLSRAAADNLRRVLRTNNSGNDFFLDEQLLKRDRYEAVAAMSPQDAIRKISEVSPYRKTVIKGHVRGEFVDLDGRTSDEPDLYNKVRDLYAKRMEDAPSHTWNQPKFNVENLDVDGQYGWDGKWAPPPGFTPKNHRWETVYNRISHAFSSQEASRMFREAGIDGLRYRGDERAGSYHNYVVFNPEQIQVHGHDILEQSAKGAVSFDADGKALIHAFQSADVSTIAHELGHIFRRGLDAELLAKAESALDVKDGNWTVDHEEKFARGFERYLRDGHAPTEALRSVFQSFKQWLGDIYQSLKGSSLEAEVSPQLREVFDRMLGSETVAPESPVAHAMQTEGLRPASSLAVTIPGAEMVYRDVANIVRKEIVPALRTAAKGVGEAAGQAQGLLAPSSRGEMARIMKGIMRENMAEFARKSDILNESFKKVAVEMDKLPIEAKNDFIDRMERGQEQSSPELEAIASSLRAIRDDRVDQVRALGTGKLQSLIENYFPHIWKDPTKAIDAFQQAFARRPFEGNKSWTRQRVIDYDSEGRAMGLERVTDNPIELMLTRVHQMDKFIMAHKVMNEAKELGISNYRRAFEPLQPGETKINDTIGTVYGNPNIPVEEFTDKAVTDALNSVIDKLDVNHERRYNAGRGKLGFARRTGDEMVTQYATDTQVVAHELGHILDFKFGLWDKLTAADRDIAPIGKSGKQLKTGEITKELRALADKTLGENPSSSRQSYARNRYEKMAHMLEAYVHAPEMFKQVAPNTYKVFRDFLDSNPDLHELRDVQPGLELSRQTNTVKVQGQIINGYHVMPEPAARLINNYLSPGLQQKSAAFRGYRMLANTMNQFQLGWSGFHAGFVTMDAITSRFALGIYEAAHGDVLKGLRTSATSLTLPIQSFIEGNKMMKEWSNPGSQGEIYAKLVAAEVQGGGRSKMDAFYSNNAWSRMTSAWNDSQGPIEKIVRAGLRLPFALTEKAMAPIQEYLVPRMKQGLFAQMAEYEMKKLGPDATLQQTRDAYGKVWDSVDNRLGQLVYDNLFWDRTTKDIAMASVRSLGWNLGTFRELGGGIIDWGRFGKNLVTPGEKADFTHRMAYTIALPAVTALFGAIAQKILTGDAPGELKDYFYPKTGATEADGTPARMTLPTYMKDVYAYYDDEHKALTIGGNPFRTVMNKLHPAVASISEMLQNKDYYGVQIRNEDDPIMQQLKDVALFGIRTVEPFAIQGIARNLSQRPFGASTILPMIGITPAPKSLEQTPAEELLTKYSEEHRTVGARTKAEAEKSQQRYDLEAAYRTRDKSAAQKIVHSGALSVADIKLAQKQALIPRDAARFSKLPLEEKLNVYERMSPEERSLFAGYNRDGMTLTVRAKLQESYMNELKQGRIRAEDAPALRQRMIAMGRLPHAPKSTHLPMRRNQLAEGGAAAGIRRAGQ